MKYIVTQDIPCEYIMEDGLIVPYLLVKGDIIEWDHGYNNKSCYHYKDTMVIVNNLVLSGTIRKLTKEEENEHEH